MLTMLLVALNLTAAVPDRPPVRPSARYCAVMRQRHRYPPGCRRYRSRARTTPPRQPPVMQPRPMHRPERFIVCPGSPRCPPRR